MAKICALGLSGPKKGLKEESVNEIVIWGGWLDLSPRYMQCTCKAVFWQAWLRASWKMGSSPRFMNVIQRARILNRSCEPSRQKALPKPNPAISLLPLFCDDPFFVT